MYRSLLVPLDGSVSSEHALPYALSIARESGATLNLVHVHSQYESVRLQKMSLVADVLDVEIKKRMQHYFDHTVKRLTEVSSVPVAFTLLEGRYVAEVINGHAASTDTDIIVMTTHGRGPLSQLWLGSVADELVQRSTIPILLVQPHQVAADFNLTPVLRRILVPLDGSQMAEQVLEPAVNLGRLMEADYELLRVCEPLPEIDLNYPGSAVPDKVEHLVDALRNHAQDYLDQMAERLNAHRATAHTHVAVGHHTATVILDIAQKLAVDLIAMETHGRGGLARLRLGSVADKVLRGASVPPIPVMLHRSVAG